MAPWQVELIGLTAAALTTAAFVPQLIKILKTKETTGVSLTMYLVMFTGIVTWFIYGLLIESVAVIAANLVTGILQIGIILRLGSILKKIELRIIIKQLEAEYELPNHYELLRSRHQQLVLLHNLFLEHAQMITQCLRILRVRLHI